MTKKIEIRCIKCPLGCLAELTVNDENNVLDVSNTQCKDGKTMLSLNSIHRLESSQQRY